MICNYIQEISWRVTDAHMTKGNAKNPLPLVVPLACTHLFLTLMTARLSPRHLRELCFPTGTHNNWTQRVVDPCVPTFTAADLATELKPQGNLRMTLSLCVCVCVCVCECVCV